MIEVTVHDIIVCAPKGEEVKWLAGPRESERPPESLPKLGSLRIVLLKEVAGERILPIWVGSAEGNRLALQLVNLSALRPLTYDLMARLLQEAEIPVERVAVTHLRDKTFYATIWVRVGGRSHEVDARPVEPFPRRVQMLFDARDGPFQERGDFLSEVPVGASKVTMKMACGSVRIE
jgi:hypothetical protein